MKRALIGVFGGICLITSALAAPVAKVVVRNPIAMARPSETIVLQAAQLRSLLSVDDVRKIHVRDENSAKEVLIQAVDTNDDGTFEEFLFQADFAAKETRNFALSVGEKQVPKLQDFKAYGRFVQERRDDFAWENDRIAHRTYGVALETWPQEPLTSSSIDVWTKRVPRLVINDWYMVDDYHHDHGEGADLYSAGSTRGCGGNGIWADGNLYPSANFRTSRTLANGPIRVLFELHYPAWEAGGVKVSEVKKVSLDAGQNFDRFESHYTVEGDVRELADAIGIRKGQEAVNANQREQGTLRTWEKLPGDGGRLGCAIIANPASILDFTEDKSNFLVTAKIPGNTTIAYYAGFGWSKNGFATVEDWDRYVAQFAARLKTPLEISVSGP